MSQKQTSKFKEREITIRDKPFYSQEYENKNLYQNKQTCINFTD